MTNKALVLSKKTVKVSKQHEKDVSKLITSFLDVSISSIGSETYYNTKKEQLLQLTRLHDGVFVLSRDLYTVMLLLPGVNDFNKQVGLLKLLQEPKEGEELVTNEQERNAIYYLAKSFTAPRLLKFFEMIRKEKINNARVRRLIFKTILDNPNFPLWCVKYKTKVRNALTHAWGIKRASAIKYLFERKINRFTNRETAFILETINNHVTHTKLTMGDIHECVCFVLGGHRRWSVPLLADYEKAKVDLNYGKDLPKVVLEGIRGRFFDDKKDKDLPEGWEIESTVSSKEVLKLTKNNLDETEKMRLQNTAERENIKIEWDPKKQKLVNLFVYGFEKGFDKKIKTAITKKAKEASDRLILDYDKISVVVDVSQSMFGTDKRKYRPISVALAIRNVLTEKVKDTKVVFTGEWIEDSREYVVGETSLAKALIEAIEYGPEAVFLLTDGYENAPAGRTNEVILALREIGINIPIYQLAPVVGAESSGVKSLSKDVSLVPVQQPEAIGTGMVRALLENDVAKGIKSLIGISKPLLKGASK